MGKAKSYQPGSSCVRGLAPLQPQFRDRVGAHPAVPLLRRGAGWGGGLGAGRGGTRPLRARPCGWQDCRRRPNAPREDRDPGYPPSRRSRAQVALGRTTRAGIAPTPVPAATPGFFLRLSGGAQTNTVGQPGPVSRVESWRRPESAQGRCRL